MNSLLYELYNGDYDTIPKWDLAQRELEKKIGDEWDKVQKMLGDEFVDRLLTLEAERADIRNFRYYREGFQLGVRLMLEALTSATG